MKTPFKILGQFQDTMLLIPTGTFSMGDEIGDLWEACRPVQTITVPDFYLGQYPVTQALWNAVRIKNPSPFEGDDRPVESVSWNDIQRTFLPALRKITGLHYRLPSEAEWEYAARGGPFHTEGYKYAGSDRLKDVGWYQENSDSETKPVGLKYPNQLGLYDMSGNVYEWCEDDWHETLQGIPNKGAPWVDKKRASDRVIRGGYWDSTARHCRVAGRNFGGPVNRDSGIGFRLALSLQSDGRPEPMRSEENKPSLWWLPTRAKA